MGPRDGDGDFLDRTEVHIKLVLEQKGKPLDSEKTIQHGELLRQGLGLSEEDIGAVLSSALFSRRHFPYIRTVDNLAVLIEVMDEQLGRISDLFKVKERPLF